MKPPELVERAIAASSAAGDLVLDPFGGSADGSSWRAGRAGAALLRRDPGTVGVVHGRCRGPGGTRCSRARFDTKGIGWYQPLVMAKGCTFEHPDGRPCGAHPLKTGSLRYWHEPEKGEEATEARRLGGLRRRREKTLSGAYDFAGLGSVDAIRRILEIAAIDTLGLDNSVAGARVLIAVALAAARLLEVEELASYRQYADNS